MVNPGVYKIRDSRGLRESINHGSWNDRFSGCTIVFSGLFSDLGFGLGNGVESKINHTIVEFPDFPDLR